MTVASIDEQDPAGVLFICFAAVRLGSILLRQIKELAQRARPGDAGVGEGLAAGSYRLPSVLGAEREPDRGRVDKFWEGQDGHCGPP